MQGRQLHFRSIRALRVSVRKRGAKKDIILLSLSPVEAGEMTGFKDGGIRSRSG
jgi:hypothetical protein